MTTYTFDELHDSATDASRLVLRTDQLVDALGAAISALQAAATATEDGRTDISETREYEAMLDRLAERKTAAEALLAARQAADEDAWKAVRRAEAAAGVDPDDDARFSRDGTYIAPIPAGAEAL